MRMSLSAMIVVAGVAGAANAQFLTLLQDDFNDGMESWWQFNDLRTGGSPFMWDTNDQFRRDGGFGDPYGNFTDGDGLAATAASDAAPGNYDVAMVTPVVSLPSDPNGLVLSYESNYQNFQGSDRAHTDISTDGGQSWASLLQWSEDHGSLFGSIPIAGKKGETVVIDLSPYAGQEVQVRFRYFEPNGGGLSFYWQIDNFSITGVPTPAGSLALAGAGGLLAVRRRR